MVLASHLLRQGNVINQAHHADFFERMPQVASTGESLFTGLEMLRHLVLRKLSLTKGANAFGYRSTSGLGFHLFPPPTSLTLSY